VRRAGFLLLGAAATSAIGAGVLVAEWKLAKRGPQLPPGDVTRGGRVGGGGPALRLVWLGDSLVTGAGASAPEATVPQLVAEGLGRPVELVIAAVSGSRVRDVADAQAPLVEGYEPDAVVVCVGTNDALYRTRLAEVWTGAQRLLAALPPVPVVVAGPTDVGAAVRLRQPLRWLTGRVGRRISAALRAATEATGARYVDLAAATGGAVRRDPARLLAVDGFHPSDDGHRLVADAILEVLRPTLAVRTGEQVTDGHR
jgi:lysophospholipase L1-like esterase